MVLAKNEGPEENRPHARRAGGALISILFDDAGSEYLQFDAGPDLAALPISLGVWFKPDAVGITQGIFGHGDVGFTDDHWTIYVDINDDVVFRRRNPTTVDVVATTSVITTSAWTFIAATQSTATDIAIYANDAETTNTATDVQPGPATGVMVGAFADSLQSFPCSGRLFWPFIYNVTLTTDEFLLLSTGVSPRAVRRNALKWFGVDNGDSMMNVIGNDLPDTTGGTPIFSADNPFEAQRLGQRNRTRSRPRIFA